MSSHPVVDMSIGIAIPSNDAFTPFIARFLMTLSVSRHHGTLLCPFCTHSRGESKYKLKYHHASRLSSSRSSQDEFNNPGQTRDTRHPHGFSCHITLPNETRCTSAATKFVRRNSARFGDASRIFACLLEFGYVMPYDRRQLQLPGLAQPVNPSK